MPGKKDSIIKDKQGFFYIIPAPLVEHGTHLRALLYGLIASYSNKDGYCWASNRCLAEKLSRKDESIIRDALSSLKKDGWLKIEDRMGKNRRLFPKIPDIQPAEITAGTRGNNRTQPAEITAQSNIKSNIVSNVSKDNIECDIPSRIKSGQLKGGALLKVWCQGNQTHSGVRTRFCPGYNKRYCLAWFNTFKRYVDVLILQKKICTQGKFRIFQRTAKYYQIFNNQLKDYLEKDPGGMADLFRKWDKASVTDFKPGPELDEEESIGSDL